MLEPREKTSLSVAAEVEACWHYCAGSDSSTQTQFATFDVKNSDYVLYILVDSQRNGQQLVSELVI